MLYFTSTWLFCNSQVVLLNPFTFSGPSPQYPPMWQSSKRSLYLWFSFCPASFIWVSRFNYWWTYIYCNFTVCIFYLPLKEDCLTFYIYNTSFMVMNSFGFFLPGKLFICPSYRNDSFAEYSNLGCRPLLFITLNISCQSLLACKVSFWEISWRSHGSSLVANKMLFFTVF